MSLPARLRRCLGLACLAALPLPSLAAEPFSFVVVGDQPYGNSAATIGLFRALTGAINAADPALVIHVGDTKSGGTLCTDATLDERLDLLNAFAAPTLYTPGDNEWVDCHRLIAGKFDPLDRLDRIRRTYFAAPDRTLGQDPAPLTHQGADGFPENARLPLGDVMFVTAHVVGSNNNFEATRPGTAKEFAARDAANRKWLTDSFAAAVAADSKALVLAIHANMFLEGFGTEKDPEGFFRHSGYKLFAETLVWQAGIYRRPVLLVHGDGHKFRMLRPFPVKAPNVMALQTFGGDHMHAVQVHVTPDAPYPFAVEPLINPDQPLVRR